MSHADRATYKVQFDNGRTANRQARVGSVPALPPPGPARVPRVARLMALAIRFDGLVRCGQVKDFAQIARLGYVTRGRLSQIMDLANLAPDIQEELLFLEPAKVGIRRIQEVVTDPMRNLASAAVSASAPVQQAANVAMEGPEELDPSAAPGSIEAAQGVEATLAKSLAAFFGIEGEPIVLDDKDWKCCFRVAATDD
jgi:hypothetical protein